MAAAIMDPLPDALRATPLYFNDWETVGAIAKLRQTESVTGIAKVDHATGERA